MKTKYNKGTTEIRLPYGSIVSQFKFLQGKVLTVIEASYSDERQLKAVKDLVNKMFSEQMTWVSQLCYPDLPMWSREQVAESGVDVDKVEREAVLE
jgi:hypothetical protein